MSLARKEKNLSPEAEFDDYKKDIGKQYMDGLISDKEYEDMLEAKRAELGLGAPSEPIKEAEGPECPSCGALVNAQDTECGICGTTLAPVLSDEGQEAPVTGDTPPKDTSMPDEDIPRLGDQIPSQRICATCGSAVSEVDTMCTVCGGMVEPAAGVEISAEAPGEEAVTVKEGEPAPEDVTMKEGEPIPEVPEEEIVCPSCGAFMEAGATVCMICDTPITGAEAPLEEEIEPMPSHGDIEMPLAEEALEEAPAPETVVTTEETVLGENEIICPSCSKVIPADSGSCPECWTDLSLYVRCPSCSLLSPAGEKLCRECFAPLGTVEEEPEPMPDIGLEVGPEISLPDEEVIISEELKEEMATIEIQEEQGKECLVCGAIFGPEDTLCPICGIEFGMTVEEPAIPETIWDHMEIEIPPTIRTCPSCHTNITGLDATEREVSEGKWFYRGLVTIFTGIFFTSFSIWARGVSAENRALEMEVPPTDVVLNLLGWILVLLGAVFWFLSWRLHGQRSECPECGVETEQDMMQCINCGADLGRERPEDVMMEDGIDESLLPSDEEVMTGEMPPEDEQVAEEPMPDEDLTVPEAEFSEEAPPTTILPETEPMPEIPGEPEAPMEVPEPEPVPEITGEPEAPIKASEPKPIPEIPEEPEAPEPSHGEELPIDHEQHKKCPGCGIYVELEERICPVCDTEFAPEPAAEPDIEVPSEDEEIAALEPEIEIPTEDEELAGLGLGEEAPEPSIDDITIPDSSLPSIECPSCGADVEAGTKICPVCEYPLVQE